MKRLSDIAKKHNVLPSQIRYYIKFGLINPSNKTQGGFYLFNEDDEKKVDIIFELKEKGMELNKIKEEISGGIKSE